MANLLERASVVLTPTAYNNGEALCIKPDDASGDFTFSRNSAATRVNAKGLVKNVQILSSNLVQNGDFSEEGSEEVSNGDFSNGSTDWSLGTGWSIGEDKAVYTGTSNSDLAQNSILTSGKTYKLQYEIISSTLVNGIVKISGTTATAQNTLSQTIGTHTEYFIANGTAPTNFNIRIVSNTSGQYEITNISVKEVGQNWDLGTGWGVSNSQLTHDGSTTAATALQNIGLNGSAGTIYKLTLNVVSATNADLRFYSPNVGYISQIVNTGDALTYLLESNGSYDFLAARNYSGAEIILDNVSVKEYSGQEVVPDSGCGSWLWEPQSTNLITQSELFSDASWVKLGAGTGSAAIVTSDYAISPDGTQNASRLQCDLNGGGGSVSNQSLIYDLYTSSGNQSLSIYVKSNNGLNQTIYFSNTQTSGDTITVTNEWQRFEFNHITATYVFAIGLRGRSGGAIDDTADILIWGAQVEQQSYATSYIPTEGSQTTRNSDLCTNGGSLASINSTEGVLYFEGSTLVNGGANRYISLSNNTSSNRLQVIFHNNSNRLSIGVAGAIGSVGSINDFSFVQTNNNKVAVSYSALGLKLFVNGILRGSNTDNASFTPNTLTTLDFALWNQTTAPFEGNTKCLALFEALTDAELISLTTI